jgi:hypothetical protein
MSVGAEPNLFIIGAAKAGTTSLYSYLSAHPAIFMCSPKEPNFFVKEAVSSGDLDWYRSLFVGAQGYPVVGEASVTYTWLPRYTGVPERIASFSPNARFIYLLREPADRAISHYRYNLSTGIEQRDLLTALLGDSQYADYSRYGMQIAPYLERFGVESVYVLTLERLKAEPLPELKRLFSWLGIDPKFSPPALDRARNITPASTPRSKLLSNIRHSAMYAAIAPRVPRALRRSANRLSTRSVRLDPKEVRKARTTLHRILEADTDRLIRLLGREFPEWWKL